MILESKAIDTPEERLKRINLLDKMSPEQKQKLEDILTKGKVNNKQ